MADRTIGDPSYTHLVIKQGETTTLTVTVRDSASALVDLTGYTARLHVRAAVADAATLTERVSPTNITMGGALGTIAVTWTAAETAAFTWTTGWYDLEMVSAGGVVTRLLQGRATVDLEVTR